MLYACSNFHMSEHRCCIEGSVSNFSAWIDRDSYGFRVALSIICLELPDRVAFYHAGPNYDLQLFLLQQCRMEGFWQGQLRIKLDEIYFAAKDINVGHRWQEAGQPL